MTVASAIASSSQSESISSPPVSVSIKSERLKSPVEHRKVDLKKVNLIVKKKEIKSQLIFAELKTLSAMNDMLPVLEDFKSPVFSDLISVFSNTSLKSMFKAKTKPKTNDYVIANKSNDRNYVQLMLDSSLQHYPDAADSEKYDFA